MSIQWVCICGRAGANGGLPWAGVGVWAPAVGVLKGDDDAGMVFYRTHAASICEIESGRVTVN